MLRNLLFAMVLFFVCLLPARADVSLLLHEAIGVSGEETSAGHAGVYFSNLCSDNATTLRLCRPGEMGVVVSAYPAWGADQPYEWLAVPLLPYLYGVTSEQEIPLYANGEIRTMLRDKTRRHFFKDIVADSKDGTIPLGRWKEVIGSALNRDIYAFTLKTTPEEDARVLAHFKQRPNVSQFNTMYKNCADFARETINLYFPHAAKRDVLNDFTMTTPKAITKSLTRYAAKRPERLLTITKYSQLDGCIRRSLDNRKFSEWALFSKKYFLPQIILKQQLIPIFGLSYYLVGYFSAHHQYRKYANPEIAQLNLLESSLKRQPADQKLNVSVSVNTSAPAEVVTSPRLALAEIAIKKEAERTRFFGDVQTWAQYKTKFSPLLQKAIADGLFVDEKEVKTFFKDLELQSAPQLDANGLLTLKVSTFGKEYLLGITHNNILSADSNPTLAYKLLLAKINAELLAKEKERGSLDEFEMDWELMQTLAQRSTALPRSEQPISANRQRFLEHPEKTTFKQKFKKLFLLVSH